MYQIPIAQGMLIMKKNMYKRLLALSMIVLCCLATTAPINAKKHESSCKVKCFKHNIQLQLCDSLGFPVPGTKFWITLDIIKECSKKSTKVTIQIPLINFQTGQIANAPKEVPFLPPLVPGGYLYTSYGYLPEELRPNGLVPHAVVAASNNGLSPVFSFEQDPETLPNPPAGYIVQITNAGALVVQCAGTFGNIIPPGPQILMPTTITYIVKPKQKICKNYTLSNGFINTTRFTDPSAADSGFRDSHLNDAYDGRTVWSWTDNSMVADKTNGTMNLMIAIGKTNKKGKLKISAPIQLSDLTPGVMAWDTATAINRTDRDNIVISYGVIDNNQGTSILYSAVSFDGGKTWPINEPLNLQPVDGFGDARGVASDKYGNMWYSASAQEAPFKPAIFYVSSNNGVSYELIFSTPDPMGTQAYDYPQYCFGTDKDLNYGLYFQCTLIDFVTRNQIPTVGFIPISGLGDFGLVDFVQLPALMNSAIQSDLTASADGRVWLQSIPRCAGAYSYVSPITLVFKSPGLLDENYAGAWHTIILDNNEFQYDDSDSLSQPVKGYIFHSVQSIFYDTTREALYAIVAAENPDGSQNMRIFLIISRDNGQTWSTPIDISNSRVGNRGFQALALDSVTNDLLFGWYDGRNDPTFKSVEYFGAILPARTLDKLVAGLPLSNPLYVVPSAA